jgi:GTP-binding protein|tara:strand:+ start:914 stop:1516 length:603 start_codon:yes stop_codon:yes gene_type:complete
MKAVNSVFEKSSKSIDQCPKSKLPEYAIIGRSNVGKSSLINSLVNNKKIAKTSSTPGKTILINHFKINESFYLVDLPGYGYATLSKKIKEDIKKTHKSYFKLRKQLLYTFLLIDIRHDLQKIDIEFMEFLNDNLCPFVIIFTKSDKLKSDQIGNQINNLRKQLSDYWDELPESYVSSSKDKSGIDDIFNFIEDSIKEYQI